MKSSKIILTITGSLLIIVLIISLFVMRNDMQTILERSPVVNYQSVSMENFEEVEFSGNWKVKIRPGRVCEVQMEVKNDTLPKPKIENKNGKQLFKFENENDTVHIKLSAPSLKKIIGSHGAMIYMQDYPADSIMIELKDKSSFTGKDNQFGNISFKTSGEAAINMIESVN